MKRKWGENLQIMNGFYLFKFWGYSLNCKREMNIIMNVFHKTVLFICLIEDFTVQRQSVFICWKGKSGENEKQTLKNIL